MKKLILALTVAFMLVAGSAFAASINCIMYASENNGLGGNAGQAGPLISSDYTFTVETDAGGNITHFTGLWSDYFYAHSDGGWDPRDSSVPSAGDQIFPNSQQQTVSVVEYNGSTTTTGGLWFKGQSNPTGTFGGLVFNVGLLGLTYTPGTDTGEAIFGPNMVYAETYIFHENAVPIPGAAWLLLSGLVGIIGLRRRS